MIETDRCLHRVLTERAGQLLLLYGIRQLADEVTVLGYSQFLSRLVEPDVTAIPASAEFPRIDSADRIRGQIPDVAITTDIIVGFPGEQDCDIDDTIDVIRRVGFDNAFTFIYSKRAGTPAAKMPDQVPDEDKNRMFDRVLAAVQETAHGRAEKLTGRTMEALAEEVNVKDSSYITARLSNNMLVHVPGDPSMIGKMLQVRLDECRGFYFFGSVV